MTELSFYDDLRFFLPPTPAPSPVLASSSSNSLPVAYWQRACVGRVTLVGRV